ncbi:MAG: carboxypeptidase-like regulatory domain-containing protein, partial [Odoribacter sp.]
MKKRFRNNDRYSGLRKYCILMKTVILFMAFSVLQVRAEVKSQETLLNLKTNNASLEEVLKMIELQTDYTCLYSYDDVVKIKHLNLDFTNVPISIILEKCMKGTPLQYKIVDQTIVIRSISGITAQQQKKEGVINGRVTDNRLNPLPGVTVVIKGTKLGVVTDAIGQFKILYPEGMDVTLVFSFIGMKNYEVKITNQKEVIVTLEEDVKVLEDVVVTGFSRVKKSSFTGNVTTVNREQLLKTNNKSVIGALQAFDPSFRIKENSLWGSDPNALPEFNIRGESSIGMDKSLDQENLKQTQRTGLKDNPNLPIFILDGFEVSVQKIYDMDMNRISGMTILKDAAATALYGSRAANGVVVVTTIAPKPGELQVSYNATLSFELPDLSDYNLCNAAEKLEVERLSGLYKGETQAIQVEKD